MRKIKIFTTIAFMALFGVIFTNNVSAFTLSPASGNLTGAQQIQVRASSAGTSSGAVSIALNTTGMTVTGFSEGSGVLALGVCSGGGSFTSSSVCVDVASTGADFTVGQVIGTISVNITSLPATITAAAGAEYEDGTAVTGTLATFSSTGGTTGTLPNTAIVDNRLTYLFIGLFLISLGAFLISAWPDLKKRYA